MGYSLLFFFQRNYIFHHRYFLMEVAHIHRLVIYQLKKSPQLGSGKLRGSNSNSIEGLNSTN